MSEENELFGAHGCAVSDIPSQPMLIRVDNSPDTFRQSIIVYDYIKVRLDWCKLMNVTVKHPWTVYPTMEDHAWHWYTFVFEHIEDATAFILKFGGRVVDLDDKT